MNKLTITETNGVTTFEVARDDDATILFSFSDARAEALAVQVGVTPQQLMLSLFVDHLYTHGLTIDEINDIIAKVQ